ncbi:MAG: ComEA family DNA-binding protein [Bacteroidaceae bacterium]
MSLSRNDKIAISAIVAILLGVNIVALFFHREEKQFTSQKLSADTVSKSHGNCGDTAECRLFPFDPNTADSATFVSLGLRPKTAVTIIHYRNAGGVFRAPDDLGRIYTLSQKDYLRLKPYIRISPQYQKSKKQYQSSKKHEDTVVEQPLEKPTYISYKLQRGQTVDINIADSVMLQKIPGIGPYYARKIIRYRDRLGGFVSVSQIKEIQGLPVDVEQWLSLSCCAIEKLQINHSTFGKLLRHPYLDYKQVVAIFNFRKTHGDIHSFDELRNCSEFSSSDFARLKPYIDFSD